jgi:hypothetical protein
VTPPIPRARRSVWLAKLDPTMRFAPSQSKLLFVAHVEEACIFDLLGETGRGDDIQLSSDGDVYLVVGAASLVYLEEHDDSGVPDEVYERRLYVVEARPTKQATA